MKNIMETTGTMELNNNAIKIFKGFMISIIFTLIMLFILSAILTYTDMPESAISPVIIVISAISILIGSQRATRKIRKNGILNGGIIGLIYMGAIYVISSIVNTGFSLNTYSVVMLIAGLLAGMLGGIVGVNVK